MVVDDEKDITITLQIGLEDGGFNVDTFNDPSLASKSFKPNFYDLVLIDIVMPDIDGFDLYERLKKIDLISKRVFLRQVKCITKNLGEQSIVL
jgi:DNA-binding response OmpR family regulator